MVSLVSRRRGGVMRFLRKGKVKEIYEVSEEELEFVFTDQISVFDKVIPTLIPHKGETLCRTSAHWFQVVQDLGFRTHFLKVTDGNRMRVRRVQVIPEYDRITPSTRNFLIPLEVIARYYVAGSFHDRMQAGRIRPETVGVPRGPVPQGGDRRRQPCVELSKEFVRQYYRKTGYHQKLMEAREVGKPEPDIPPLPADVAKQVSELYVGLFERLTGERFR